jgi:hypothetical protein
MRDHNTLKIRSPSTREEFATIVGTAHRGPPFELQEATHMATVVDALWLSLLVLVGLMAAVALGAGAQLPAGVVLRRRRRTR